MGGDLTDLIGERNMNQAMNDGFRQMYDEGDEDYVFDERVDESYLTKKVRASEDVFSLYIRRVGSDGEEVAA